MFDDPVDVGRHRKVLFYKFRLHFLCEPQVCLGIRHFPVPHEYGQDGKAAIQVHAVTCTLHHGVDAGGVAQAMQMWAILVALVFNARIGHDTVHVCQHGLTADGVATGRDEEPAFRLTQAGERQPVPETDILAPDRFKAAVDRSKTPVPVFVFVSLMTSCAKSTSHIIMLMASSILTAVLYISLISAGMHIIMHSVCRSFILRQSHAEKILHISSSEKVKRVLPDDFMRGSLGI